MNLFEHIKSQLKPIDVINHYNVPVERGQMILCPFHQERTPSLKLYDDHFYCFGCHATGDVITLAAGLLGLQPYEAAKRLAEDFTIRADRPPGKIKKPKKRPVQQLWQSNLSEYFYWLKHFKQTLAPSSPEDTPDPLFVKSCREISYIGYLLDCMDLNPEATMILMDSSGLNQKIAQELSLLDRREISA